MKPLVVIPARGGSKRLPGKNIKRLNGRPLINYTIDAARSVFEDAVICVSTDDESIKEVAEQAKLEVPFMRPMELASDTADSRSVFLHAYNYYKQKRGYDASVIIVLQPTSPFRTDKHINEAMELYDNSIDMVVSAFETTSNPYFVLFEESSLGYLEKSKKGNFTRKQDVPKVWELNGAIYIINTKSLINQQVFNFEKVIKYEMKEEESIDIDTKLDWQLAELLMSSSALK